MNRFNSPVGEHGGAFSPWNARTLGLLAALMLLHASICISSMWNSSATFDEPDYFGVGRYIFETGNWKISSATFHPPLSYHISSLPLFFTDLPDSIWKTAPVSQEGGGWIWYDDQIGSQFLFGAGGDPMTLLRICRLTTIGLSMLLLMLVACWSADVFGVRAGLAAGFVYALSPNVISDSRLVTTDLPFTLFFTAHFYVLHLLAKKWDGRRLAAAAMLAGAMIGTKLNGLFALSAGALIVLLAAGEAKLPFRSRLVAVITYAGIPFIIVWMLYGLHVGPLRNPGQYGAVLEAVTSRWPRPLAELARQGTSLQVPMPQYGWLMAHLSAYNIRGVPAFLLGEFRTHGWWYYFPVAILVKTPLPILIAGLVGIAPLWRLGRKQFLLFFLLPAAVVLGPAMTASINIGIRHILPLYPLIFLSCGAAAGKAWSSRSGKMLLIVLAVWLIVGTVRVHPSYLSYFNEIAGGTEGGEEWLSDSNIDHGEDFYRLALYQKEHGIDTLALAFTAPIPPEAYGVVWRPLGSPDTGWIAVEVMTQQFARAKEPNPLAFLDEYRPVNRIGGSIKIYKIPN